MLPVDHVGIFCRSLSTSLSGTLNFWRSICCSPPRITPAAGLPFFTVNHTLVHVDQKVTDEGAADSYAPGGMADNSPTDLLGCSPKRTTSFSTLPKSTHFAEFLLLDLQLFTAINYNSCRQRATPLSTLPDVITWDWYAVCHMAVLSCV